MLQVQTLLEARLYPDENAVIQDALRSLLREKPQLRIEMAIHRYQTQDISLAKAAHLAGVSFDRMKAILVARGIQPRLGPADEEEARQEIAEMRRFLGVLVAAVGAKVLSPGAADQVLTRMIEAGYRSPYQSIITLL